MARRERERARLMIYGVVCFYIFGYRVFVPGVQEVAT